MQVVRIMSVTLLEVEMITVASPEDCGLMIDSLFK